MALFNYKYTFSGLFNYLYLIVISIFNSFQSEVSEPLGVYIHAFVA